MSIIVKKRRQYDPPEYDDKALVKWLVKDQKRVKVLKEKKNGCKSKDSHS